MPRLYLFFLIVFTNLIYSLDYKSNYYFGYDNNVLKYSDNENILFSRYISTQQTLSTKFKILERFTRFNFHIKKNHFFDNNKKSNYSVSLKLKQPLGNYKFLDFSYNYINDIYLREYVDKSDINLTLVEAVSDEGSIISSTRIREKIKDGYIRRANFELGWIYGFDARVVSGSGRGHTLSFPTANFIPLVSDQLLPKTGVYLARGRVVGKQLYGMCNLGYRPTFDEGKFVMEVHFFDFHDIDLYSQNIRIEFLERIRDEIKFESKGALISQLTRDKKYCLGLLDKYN